MRRPRLIAVAGVLVVALVAAGCRHGQTRAHRNTVTKEAPTTATTTGTPTGATGVRPAEKGRNCVLAAGGEDDPARAMNECRESLAQLYGVNSSNFAKAWQEAQALATCLTYSGVEECLAAG